MTSSEGYTLTGTLDELRRLAEALLYAASDMAQVRAACDMLEDVPERDHRSRALETAIVVCYARAFTTSNLKRLSANEFAPKDGTEQRELHDTPRE